MAVKLQGWQPRRESVLILNTILNQINNYSYSEFSNTTGSFQQHNSYKDVNHVDGVTTDLNRLYINHVICVQSSNPTHLCNSTLLTQHSVNIAGFIMCL